jgi:hypothetical protein
VLQSGIKNEDATTSRLLSNPSDAGSGGLTFSSYYLDFRNFIYQVSR